MNISIKRRIYYSFSLLVFLFMLSGLFTILTLSSHKRSSVYVSEIVDPSLHELADLNETIIKSKMYCTSWVFHKSNDSDKDALLKLHNKEYVELKSSLKNLSKRWVQKNWVDTLNNLFTELDNILLNQRQVMGLLRTSEDYNNPVKKLEAERIMDNIIIPKTTAALNALKLLSEHGRLRRLQQSVESERSSNRLRIIIIAFAITTTSIGIFLSLYFVNVIVAPIKKIRKIINDLGKGNIRVIDNKENNDEIGEMVHSVNILSKNLWQTARFAQEVGSRNFAIPFEPLSNEDTLGKALVAMRDDLKNSEVELLKAHRELSMLFNSLDEVFFSVDMINLKVIHVSKACEKLYGYSPSYFLMNHSFWLEIIHPDDKHVIQDEDKKLLRGETVNNQYRIIRKDKAIRWVESKIIPAFDDRGKLVRVDGITRDVTERKLAEAQFRKSEERYRQIVETSSEGIWLIDKDDYTTFVNKSMCDMLGYLPEEVMGRKIYNFMSKESRENALVQIERRKQGINESHVSTLVTKNGRLVHVHVNTNPVLDEHGNYNGALAMMTDITQRRLDEEALKKSEANLRTIFNNTELAYVLINDAFEVVSFNALADIFSQEQTSKRLAEGTSIINYFPGERKSFIKGIIDKVMRGETVNYEMSYLLANGVKKWYEIRWVGVANKEKKNWGFILTSKDITEKKNARLEREKVTADLIQRNKDLQQFTYIVSHNLRAPVANIMGISNLLNLTIAEGNVKENENLLHGLSLSVQQLDNIILDLNDILKVRNPGSEIKEKVSFSSLVLDIKSSINHIVSKENAVIKFDFSQAGHAFTLKSYIYSIFYNLILNSIKYKQPSLSPLIEIKGYEGNKKVHLSFKDNGKGIDMQKNGSDIFKLYKRFDNTVEGKGIGLYMVKTAVETLGGSISLHSEVNKGTEFNIELPMLN